MIAVIDDPLGLGLHRETLTAPRAVRVRASRRPALLIGYVTDRSGRRLWAEIVKRTSFVRPTEIEEEP